MQALGPPLWGTRGGAAFFAGEGRTGLSTCSQGLCPPPPRPAPLAPTLPLGVRAAAVLRPAVGCVSSSLLSTPSRCPTGAPAELLFRSSWKNHSWHVSCPEQSELGESLSTGHSRSSGGLVRTRCLPQSAGRLGARLGVPTGRAPPHCSPRLLLCGAGVILKEDGGEV